MPPKASSAPIIVAPPSPSPPPTTSYGGTDDQDILIIQDLMDTLEQIPAEMTRVHSDLNELGAVLYSTLQSLELKLNQLIDWIADKSIKPEQRFQLLQEIAEEAARYKLGGDDKIRVAGGACDGIMAHQRHITNLLDASTFLDSAPPSPYTTALTLTTLPTVGMSRRQIARAANSPFGGAGRGSGEGRTGDTPTKKKKVSRVQQLGREDDDSSSVGGRDKKAPVKKKRIHNRALSPTDSVGSASAFAGPRAMEPRTARQLAAAHNKARQLERADESDESDMEEDKKEVQKVDRKRPGARGTPAETGLGLDMGGGALGGHSRESTGAGRSGNGTPVVAKSRKTAGGVSNGHGTGTGNGAGGASGSGNASGTGVKRRYDGEESDSGEDKTRRASLAVGPTSGIAIPGIGGAVRKQSNGMPSLVAGAGGGAAGAAASAIAGFALGGDGHVHSDGEAGEADGQVYCTCRQVSYGEMIGCDDDDCEIEWYHIACLGFSAPPEGTWICPACEDRRKRNPKAKKSGKGRARR